MRPAQVVEPPDDLEVLPAGELLLDGGRLPGQADRAADRGRLPRRRRGPRPVPGPCPAAAAWSGCGRRSSCRRRSGRARRAPCRAAPQGRCRAARARRRTTSSGPRRESPVPSWSVTPVPSPSTSDDRTYRVDWGTSQINNRRKVTTFAVGVERTGLKRPERARTIGAQRLPGSLKVACDSRALRRTTW